ncbi:MAG: ATP-binding cassette domain-containing protein, partial [Bacteroidota bacterium]|nr:ATP-binding cassette domain-containing protein [Bacteroidota bacterium]
MKDVLLKVKDLTVKFGETTVVDHVSFQVEKGECVGLVGASGSGKSVTSLALLRLLDPRASQVSGSIIFEGKEIADLAEEEFRRYRGKDLAMIFQEPMTALDPVYS